MKTLLVVCLLLLFALLWTGCAACRSATQSGSGLLVNSTCPEARPEVGWTLDFPRGIP